MLEKQWKQNTKEYNMTYIVDTNIFLRTLIKENDQVFNDCVACIKLIKENKVDAVCPGIVISELVWVLTSFYKFPKNKVIRAVRSVLKLNGVKVVDEYNYEESLRLYEGKNAKYIDCLIANLAQEKKYTVLSYDTDFDKLNVMRKEPSELLQ